MKTLAKRIKTIKADYYGHNTLEYTVNCKNYTVTGEFHYNSIKDRIEHVHEGPRGGEYLIFW